MMLLRQLIFLITLIINNSASCLALKKKFGRLMPFTIIVFVLVFYLSGLMGTLTIGIYLYYLISAVSLFYVIRTFINDKDNIKEYILTFGLYAFVFLFIFLAVINHNRTFSLVDEWSHWAPMAEETFRLRRFHAYTDSLVWVHKVYPPFYPLLEAAYCLIVGGFKDSCCYTILQLFSLSFLLPILENNRKIVSKIITVVLIILIPNVITFVPDLVYPSLFYNSIYTDWPIAFYIGFLFYYVLTHEFTDKLDYILLSILLSGIILTKQISIAFVLLFLLMTIIKLIINKINIKRSWWIVIPIIIPLLFFISWQYITKKYQTPPDFSLSSIKIFAIFRYFGGELTGNANSIFTSFIDAFISRPIIIKPINISYLGMLVLITGLLIVFALINKSNKKNMILSSIFYFIGGIGYAYAICLSYAFSFDPSEGLTLTMYQRYMYLYILAGLIMMFLIYIEYGKENKYYIKYIVIAIVIVLLIDVDTLKYNFRFKEYNSHIKENNFDEAVKNVNQNDSILFVWQNDPEKYCYYRYKMILNKLKVSDIYRIGCKNTIEGNVCNISSDELLELFKKWDIVFISEYDDTFTDLWKESIGTEMPYNNTFYRVDNIDGKIKLVDLGG